MRPVFIALCVFIALAAALPQYDLLAQQINSIESRMVLPHPPGESAVMIYRSTASLNPVQWSDTNGRLFLPMGNSTLNDPPAVWTQSFSNSVVQGDAHGLLLIEPFGGGHTGNYVLDFDASWSCDIEVVAQKNSRRVEWGYDWRFGAAHEWTRQRIGVADMPWAGTGDYSVQMRDTLIVPASALAVYIRPWWTDSQNTATARDIRVVLRVY